MTKLVQALKESRTRAAGEREQFLKQLHGVQAQIDRLENVMFTPIFMVLSVDYCRQGLHNAYTPSRRGKSDRNFRRIIRDDTH